MDSMDSEESAFVRKVLMMALVGMKDDFSPAMIFDITVLGDDMDLEERRSAYQKDLCTTVIHRHPILPNHDQLLVLQQH